MSFFKYDDSNSQDYHNPNDESFENQTQFLKVKLIQTHNKLLKQLENTKTLETKLQRCCRKNQQLLKENQNLTVKIAGVSGKFQRERLDIDRLKQYQAKYNDNQKKNSLLVLDLEQMRNKMLAVIMEKSQYQQQFQQKNQVIGTLQQRHQSLQQKIHQLELINEKLNHQIETFKRKYQNIVHQNQKVGLELSQNRRYISQCDRKIAEIQNQLKNQKDKHNRISVQLQNCTTQLRQYKHKYQKQEQNAKGLKDQLYWLQSKSKNQNHNVYERIEKLTSELNHMNVMYKEKQRQLESCRKRPSEEASRKKGNFQQAKQLVMKLEVQQNNYINKRHEEHSKGPSKYKQQKQQYMSMISQVSDIQSALLQANLQKKKIQNEIDKIDNTKIKTKELIARRRKLEDDNARAQQQIQSIKMQLRKLKLI